MSNEERLTHARTPLRTTVGKYCEQKPPAVNDSSFCSNVDVKTFCLNGGTCNPAFPYVFFRVCDVKDGPARPPNQISPLFLDPPLAVLFRTSLATVS